MELYKDGDMYVRTGSDFVAMSVFDFALKGKHNQYNTMAACLAAATMEIRKKDPRGGTNFSKSRTPYGICINGAWC
jgi:UDP-N-acetylmuramyl tripeptide synthase